MKTFASLLTTALVTGGLLVAAPASAAPYPASQPISCSIAVPPYDVGQAPVRAQFQVTSNNGAPKGHATVQVVPKGNYGNRWERSKVYYGENWMRTGFRDSINRARDDLYFRVVADPVQDEYQRCNVAVKMFAA